MSQVLKGGGGVWKMPMGPMPAQSQVIGQLTANQSGPDDHKLT